MLRVSSLVSGLVAFWCFYGATAFSPSSGINHHRHAEVDTALDAKTAVIAGVTGYIGKSTLRESIRQGYQMFALVRDEKKETSEAGKKLYAEFLDGVAGIIECDVIDEESVKQALQDLAETKADEGKIEAVVSCLASHSGVKKDAYLIDYQATLNCLEAGRACKARHFVLLSAFCVKNPWLQFQQAKLKFEAALQEQTDITYTIVRPTAFFKSVSG
jgi:divinyl chlorophyllide a 8-vinyl-reductase